MNKKLEVRLFGRFSLSYDGKEFSSFESTRARELLALLATIGGEVTRSDLQKWLWPGDPDHSGNRLSVALYQLRQAFSELGVEAGVLVSGRGWVGLSEDLVSCDVRMFMDAARAATTTRDDGSWLDLCSRAVGLYHGRFAPGSGCPRLIEAGDALGAQFVDLVLALCTKLVVQGNRDSAISKLRLADLALSDYPPAQSRARAWLAEHGEPGRGPGYSSAVVHTQGGQTPTLSSPTLTAFLVAPMHSRALSEACEGLPIYPGSQGESYVIAPNPQVAHRIARRIGERVGPLRALITTFVGEPDAGLPAAARAYFDKVPRGEVWLGRATAALLEDTDSRTVTERTLLRGHYRLV